VESLYEQIGGMAAVAAAVDELYVRVMGDPRLAPAFQGVDMDSQRRQMRAFVATALGGGHRSSSLPSRDMTAGHPVLGVRGRDSDRLAGHLAGALHTVGVPSAQIAAILSRIVPHRDQVVGGEPAPV